MSHFSFIPASKMTLIGPVGDSSDKLNKKSYLSVIGSDGGGGVFFYSLTTVAHPASS